MLKTLMDGTITKSLTPANIKTMTQSIIAYVDRNSEILLSLDLSHRYSFNDADRDVIYKAIGITEEIMEAEITKSKNIYSGNKIQSNPFYVACMLAMHNLMVKNDEKTARMVMNYMSLMMYTSSHKGSFKHGTNKQIMDYTIAHLDNSYIIRKKASLYAFLDDNATTAFTTYKNRIIKCDDADITYVIDALWVRIKGKVKKIAQAFYANHKSGNYLNADSDNFSDEDYHEMDNVSFMVDRLTNKIYTKLLNHQFDRRFIKYAITQSDTSYQKLSNILEDIIGDEDTTDMRKLISAMIEYYVQQSGKTPEYIGRGDFIAYMKTAYASNTELPQMVTIKSTIDKWLDENMYKYGRANYGKTMKQQYRRSIYMFFIFIINNEAKVG